MNDYSDIINLPHHQSKTRPHMSMLQRAAQFMPFAALSGFDDAVKETFRVTDQRVELDEDELALLNEKLQLPFFCINTYVLIRNYAKICFNTIS